MDNVARLFLMTTNVGCPTLTAGCIEFLKPMLSKFNFEEFWSLAKSTMNFDLVDICAPVIAANFDNFSKQIDLYYSTEPEYLGAVSRDSRLTGVTMDSKFGVVWSWFESASTVRGKREGNALVDNLTIQISLLTAFIFYLRDSTMSQKTVDNISRNAFLVPHFTENKFAHHHSLAHENR
uniref:AAA_6 domain-containing protein n=1 Tax=Mesocestoides corti TaxID=53468 RepID=A0A5K3FVK6_MESCO